MPTVLRVRGHRFYFFAEEGNEAPHVHVDKGSGTMKLWLVNFTIAFTEGLKSAEIRTALKIAREHEQMLLDSWHEFHQRKN